MPLFLTGYSLDNLQVNSLSSLPIPLAEISSYVIDKKLTTGKRNWLNIPVGSIRIFFSKQLWTMTSVSSQTVPKNMNAPNPNSTNNNMSVSLQYAMYLFQWMVSIANETFQDPSSSSNSSPIFILSSNIPFTNEDFQSFLNSNPSFPNTFEYLYSLITTYNNGINKSTSSQRFPIQIWYDLGNVTTSSSTQSTTTTVTISIQPLPLSIQEYMDACVLRIVNTNVYDTTKTNYIVKGASQLLFSKTIWGIENQYLSIQSFNSVQTLQIYSPVLIMSSSVLSSPVGLNNTTCTNNRLPLSNFLLSSIGIGSPQNTLSTNRHHRNDSPSKYGTISETSPHHHQLNPQQTLS